MQTKSGKALHPIGVGTWSIAGTFVHDATAKYKGAVPAYKNEQAEIEAIRYSLTKGQNHIDCAELYGAFYTDEVVGRAIANTKREDIFVADKLWKTSVGNGLVRPTVEKMLTKLGTSYLDMLYIHAPWQDAPWREAIAQVDDLIKQGIVRHFGVSNFTVADMEYVHSVAKHQITANQMNYNVLYKNEVDVAFKKYCAAHNIQLVAYQPIKRQEVVTNEVIQAVAKAHEATPVQVALAWLLAHGALPIPKAVNKAHIEENILAAKLVLTEAEMQLLNTI